jgi:hypothetical protein
MTPGLGGSLFVRNAIKYDYCVVEAIESLMPFCEEVVVLDCRSEDETLDLLLSCAERHPRLRVIEGAEWEVADNFHRLAVLAAKAKDHLRTPWHFMLQADEVVHEDSYEPIRRAVEADGWGRSTFRIRRMNLYGDMNHMVSYVSTKKPCSDDPVRLGRREIPVVGDAESLEEFQGSSALVRKATIFHYGFVRRGAALIDKCMDMQTWFHGPGSTVDERVVSMKNRGVGFIPSEIMEDSQLVRVPIPHPKAAAAWVEARR